MIAVSGSAVRQRPGTVEAPIGGTLYLADAEGRAIHRMDPLAEAIWDVLAEPMHREAIIDLLAEAFPDAGRDRIGADVTGLLESLAAEGLIEAVLV
jgi:Coenzyme PQQ synthesis protein D (PqqD)